MHTDRDVCKCVNACATAHMQNIFLAFPIRYTERRDILLWCDVAILCWHKACQWGRRGASDIQILLPELDPQKETTSENHAL